MTRNRLLVPVLAFLTDAGLAFYTYLLCTDYTQFQKYAKATINDPDFQLQIYKVLVQTLSFILLVFLFLHLIVYFFYYRRNKFATKYVRFYLIMAIISLVLSLAFSFNIYFLLGTISFGICYSKLKTVE
jgi:hypothetical protein